jgi:hypothetical protein
MHKHSVSTVERKHVKKRRVHWKWVDIASRSVNSIRKRDHPDRRTLAVEQRQSPQPCIGDPQRIVPPPQPIHQAKFADTVAVPANGTLKGAGQGEIAEDALVRLLDNDAAVAPDCDEFRP